MKDKIKEYVTLMDNVCFPELIHNDTEMLGDRTVFHDHKNMVLWDGVSQEFKDALVALIASGEVTIRPVTFPDIILCHATCRGRIPDLPVAQRVKDYARPHWFPALICRGRSVSPNKGAAPNRR